MSRQIEVTITYLEMTDPSQLIPYGPPKSDVELREALIRCPELNRFFYAAVGGDWYWVDQREWSYQQWADYLEHHSIRTWILYQNDTPAGYFELGRYGTRDVEITHIGLLPRFIGQGLGGYLLTEAVRTAWDSDAGRVWLHTCSLDHPAALQNYLSRGFQPFDSRTTFQQLPENPTGPWTNAFPDRLTPNSCTESR
jgi:GNAT superfamily N-acetyltransferase